MNDNVTYQSYKPLHFSRSRTNIVYKVPAQPAWFSRLDAIIRELRLLPLPFVDRTTVESLLGVGPRRAQQIMAPCITERVGTSGVADRDALIEHLQRLGRSEGVFYELQRRRKVATVLERMREERLLRPQLLVEAPVRVVDQELENLPAGVRLEGGRITVDFDDPQQALEKLLALAMAISNDFDRFAKTTRRTSIQQPLSN
jgi:hypothetical protein